MRKKFLQYLTRGTSIRLQIALMLSSLFIILSLFYINTGDFNSTDPRPSLKPIFPKVLSQESEARISVESGLFVRSFPEFNVALNRFVVDLVLWFKFDPTAISLETIEKFSFEKGEILYKSPPNTKLIKGEVLATYEVRIKFSSNLDYKFFPFGDHKIYLVLTNKFVSPGEMGYLAKGSGFSIADNIYAAGWQYNNRKVEYGYSVSELDIQDKEKNILYPRVIFSIGFKKSGIRNVFLIVIPLLLMYFTGLFALSLDAEKHARAIMGLALGSMTSLLSYRFVIETLSPKVGYFTAADYLFTYILVVIFLSFLLNLYAIRRGKLTILTNAIRILFIITAYLLLVTTIYYLLFIFHKG
ncbi:hypothetical protein KAW80_02210 [Candidatus Babeliales bacterium]|nr:hypothetical protein [Candidatus Babeliales bacterium]